MNNAKTVQVSKPPSLPTSILLLSLLLFTNLAIAQNTELSNVVAAGGYVLLENDYKLTPGWWQYAPSCDGGKWISLSQKEIVRADYRASCELQIHDYKSVVEKTRLKTEEIVVPERGEIVAFAELDGDGELQKNPNVWITRHRKDSDPTPISLEHYYPVEIDDRIVIKMEASLWGGAGRRDIPQQGANVKVFLVPPPRVVPGKRAGHVKAFYGKGELSILGSGKPLRIGDPVYVGDILKTMGKLTARLVLVHQGNTTIIMMKPNTRLKINSPVEKKSRVKLFFGEILNCFTRATPKGGYEVEVHNCIAGVEGTVFETAYDASGVATVGVAEGEVRLTCKPNPLIEHLVHSGERATLDGECNLCLAALSEFEIQEMLDEADEFDQEPPPPATGGQNEPGVLLPTADSHVYAYAYRNWNGANWGKYENLAAGWHPEGGEKRAFLKFDLDGVDTSGINSAKLKLFHYHTGGGNNRLSLGVHAITEPWQEGNDTYHSGRDEQTAAPGEITWIHQPSFNFDPIAQFNPGPGTNKFVEVDITPLVMAWLTGKPNYGLMIKPVGIMSGRAAETQYGFYSREYEDIDQRPLLVLSDSGSVGQPGDPVGGLGGDVIDDDPGSIRVESATYGGNCGVAKGNVTSHIAGQCNGKAECRYTVNHRIIGDPAFGCAKTYTARYQCGNNTRVFEKSLGAEAGLGDKAVVLECANGF